MKQQAAATQVNQAKLTEHHTSGEQAEPTVAIIGYGTAGVNALIALRNAGYKGTIRVFSNTTILPYSPILTSYYAGGEKTYEECFPWSESELEALGAEVLLDCTVTELDTEAHVIHTTQGSFGYTKCVISTGASPLCFGFDDADGYKPLVLRTLDDAERLKAALTQPGCKRVLVSGASMVALKILEACLERGMDTTLVGMNPHILDFNAFPEAAMRYEKGLRKNKVELRLGQTVSSVRVMPEASHPVGRQLEVTFSTGEVDRFDEIAVAHGVKGNLDFIDEGSLETDQALVVDRFMRTSDPDVYAAGDVAQALELISGKKRIVGIWKNAALQGACAGQAIAAELAESEIPQNSAFTGSISSNTIAVKGTLFISAGATEITPERHTEVTETDELTIVCLYEGEKEGKKRLVGFNVVCDDDEAGGKAYDAGAMLTLRIENSLLLQ